jgi:hypothetical protein
LIKPVKEQRSEPKGAESAELVESKRGMIKMSSGLFAFFRYLTAGTMAKVIKWN